ncbi:hypothetical protein FRC03_004067 [Tulasnella sp. 419]|nr:hypothetical protein FRC03_004067 [Tulasnella sp. 419]
MRAQRPQPLTIDAHSFLPGLSLFTPSTAGQSSFQTPMTSNHCSTILEEDDSDVESTRFVSPTAPSKRTSNSMPLCPRVLRVADDSQSDDEFSEHAGR